MEKDKHRPGRGRAMEEKKLNQGRARDNRNLPEHIVTQEKQTAK